jgi:hypothetical protein
MSTQRKRKRPATVVTVSRSNDIPETDNEILNRDLTVTRQGRHLTQISTAIAAGASERCEDIAEEPSPWTANFYDEIHDDPPLPTIEDDGIVSIYFIYLV